MSSVMLTALDSNSGQLLDLTAMTPAEMDAIHGIRTAKAHGVDIVCRQCHRPGHLVRNHKHTAFFRHNPGEGAACILSEFGRQESTEHLAAKIAITKKLRTLKGWTAEPERRFEAGGEIVVVDVFAAPLDPDEFRIPTSWEIQVSPQPHGVTVQRSEQRRRVTGTRTAWVTPHEATLGDSLGVLTDQQVTHVVGRMYDSSHMSTPLAPITLGEFIGATQGKRRDLIWAQAGMNGEWVAYRPTPGVTPPSTTRASTGVPEDLTDRHCDRTPVPVRSVNKPTGKQPCRVCGLSYDDHSGALCRWCGGPAEHHATEDTAACLAGKQRMARARMAAGVPLNDADRLALAL